MSAPGCSRRTSRSRRRTRLRATAVPRRRSIANAMRGRSSPGSGANEIHNASLSKRRPRRSAMKSALLRHESIRRSAVAGPCVDEPSLQHGRRGWTSGDEIRGGGLGGECGVGTCVSRCSLLGGSPRELVTSCGPATEAGPAVNPAASTAYGRCPDEAHRSASCLQRDRARSERIARDVQRKCSTAADFGGRRISPLRVQIPMSTACYAAVMELSTKCRCDVNRRVPETVCAALAAHCPRP